MGEVLSAGAQVRLSRDVRARLWRDVVGAVLRDARRRRGEILAQVAARAGVSPQYLSEVERGVKEPSSEVLAAVAGALGLTLADVTRRVTVILEADARHARRRLRLVHLNAGVEPGISEPGIAARRRSAGDSGGAVLLAA